MLCNLSKTWKVKFSEIGGIVPEDDNQNHEEKIQQCFGFTYNRIGGQGTDNHQGDHIVRCDITCLPLGYEPKNHCNGNVHHSPTGKNFPQGRFKHKIFTHCQSLPNEFGKERISRFMSVSSTPTWQRCNLTIPRLEEALCLKLPL